MKICLAIVSAVVVAGGLLAAPATQAAPAAKQYKTCAQLKNDYPNGVAQTKGTATAAVNAGNKRPRVSSAVYKSNNRLDREFRGYICVSTAVQTIPPAPVPVTPPPPAPANLTVIAQTPKRPDTQANFAISWQMPTAANVSTYTVSLSNGSSKTVTWAEGVATTPEVRTYTVNAFGPFGTPVTISVVGNNSVGAGTPSTTSFTTPPEPKRTITVEISAGTGDCSDYRFCYISITNSSGGRDIHNTMGTWSYEAQPGSTHTAFVRASWPNASTCTIKFDGVVASTQTSNGSDAYCYITAPR